MFFNKFPIVDYDILSNGTAQSIPDIFRQVRTENTRLDRVTQYTYAYVGDDRPDQLSYRLYGTTEYYWTFFMINEHLAGGMKEWKMSQTVLDDFVDHNYKYHNIRLYREATDDINYNQIENMYGIDVYMYGIETGAIGKIINRHLESNSLDFIYQTDVEFVEWEQITIVDLKNMYHDLGYVDWGYVLSTSTVEDIFDKYDIRTGRNAIRYWWNPETENYHNNYEHYDLSSKTGILPVTNYDYETELNDRRNKVKVIYNFIDIKKIPSNIQPGVFGLMGRYLLCDAGSLTNKPATMLSFR